MTREEAFKKALAISKTGCVSAGSTIQTYFKESIQSYENFESFTIIIDGVVGSSHKGFDTCIEDVQRRLDIERTERVKKLRKELDRLEGITGNAKVPPGVKDGRD